MSDATLIKAAKLWAKTSAKSGRQYLTGRWGGCRVLIFENTDRQGDADPTHFLMLGEAEPYQPREGLAGGARQREEPAAKLAQKPQERGSGWKGDQYRRPRDGPQEALAGDGEAFHDDPVPSW